jgi:hypothetical protein
MGEPNPGRPVRLRPGLQVQLHRRGRRHHRRACGTGLAGLEERLHGAIAVARVDSLGGPQRVGAEQNQTEPCRGERRTQHGPVGRHAGDRRDDVVGRWPGQLHGTARLDRDEAAAGKIADARDDRGQLIPFGAAGRICQIEAVRLDLKADAADRTIGQACLTDQLCGAVGAGELGIGGVDRVPFVPVGRDGVGHSDHPFRLRNDRGLVPSSRQH